MQSNHQVGRQVVCLSWHHRFIRSRSLTKALIDAYNAQQATKLEEEPFKQRKGLADAERMLQTKTTKAATESKRIATCATNAAVLRHEVSRHLQRAA